MSAATPVRTDMEVQCPDCGARQGERCHTPNQELCDTHPARWEAREHAYGRPRRYWMAETLPGLGLRQGEVIVCQPSRLNPTKAVVLYREDGEPIQARCEVYRTQVVPIPGTAGEAHPWWPIPQFTPAPQSLTRRARHTLGRLSAKAAARAAAAYKTFCAAWDRTKFEFRRGVEPLVDRLRATVAARKAGGEPDE